MNTGFITYYNFKSGSGLIDCPELDIEDLSFRKSCLAKTYKNLFPSDKVNFELLHDNDGISKLFNIEFVANSTLDVLKKDFDAERVKIGFLKRIGNDYYVKDHETYLFIKLRIFPYEIDLLTNYENQLNHLVKFKLIVFSDKNKIRAIKIPQNFSADYQNALSCTDCEATIVKIMKDGYQIILFNSILGFLPNSIAKTNHVKCDIGDLVHVKYITHNKSSGSLVFGLV